MPNSYFRFKQFIIHQDRSAMKVCTDSCILGAWTAQRVKQAKSILDIGTGTGLLTLMLAQESIALIDTIESDRESFAQAKENIKLSPWTERIRAIEGDVRRYSFECFYDFMIINPPFFESDLLSPESKKNSAKHAVSLTLEELIPVIRSRLNAEGAFSILLPFHRSEYFENMAAANGFFLNEKLTIRQTPGHRPFRIIGLYRFKKPEHILISELTIRGESGKNSPAYAGFMEKYYLE
jgi:tRNA1Val (adenine37-N6)-methyltransferase